MGLLTVLANKGMPGVIEIEYLTLVGDSSRVFASLPDLVNHLRAAGEAQVIVTHVPLPALADVAKAQTEVANAFDGLLKGMQYDYEIFTVRSPLEITGREAFRVDVSRTFRKERRVGSTA